jgi:hypothetical protein
VSSQPQDPDGNEVRIEVVKEVREVSPFVIMHRGMGTVDPADPNRIVFEDYSPRVLPSDVPEEVPVELDEIIVPKGVSVTEPAPSSESPPTTEQPASETPVPTAPPLPSPPVGPLPFPEAAETDDGKPNPPASS